jgi:hypothetical protein
MEYAEPGLGWLKQVVGESVDELYRRDQEILGTTERVVVGRLMIYLYLRLSDLEENGWVLDQEYQRIEGEIKRPDGPLSPKIVPDLALHRRMDREGNLLVIEVKTTRMSSNPSNPGRLHDLAKLSLLTGSVPSVKAYGPRRILRLSDCESPGGQGPPEAIHLRSMVPYKYGLWLRIPPDEGAECWWFSDRKIAQGPSPM